MNSMATLALLIVGLPLLAAVIIAWLRERAHSPERAWEAYHPSLGEQETPAHSRRAAIGSLEHKTRLAFRHLGVDVSGYETLALGLLYVLVAALLILGLQTLLHLPMGIAATGGLILAGFVEQGILSSAWDAMRRDIEKDIPTLMLRLSGMIQASPNVLESLDEAARSLDARRPLRGWLEYWINEIQGRGVSAFEDMEKEAERLSPSLILAVVQIWRLWESGGSGYIESFRLVADHLSELMATRALAYAKAGRSGNLARIIVAAALISLSAIMNNPTSRDLFLLNPVTRIGLVFFFLWGGFGWFYIRTILQQVTAQS